MDKQDLLRTIPKVDVVLKETALEDLPFRADMIKRVVVEELARIRAGMRDGNIEKSPTATAVAQCAARTISATMEAGLKPVINATGVIVHTNLGRAPLAKQALKAIETTAGYSNLEFDLARGERGSRQDHIRMLTRTCFGASDALVVNNNAAAVLLALAALARGREVIVSRGELVEIGGSFRIPDVMALSGAKLKEIGTTNKTRLSDYTEAISDDTALIMKVHRSNFAVVGFSEEAQLKELSELAQARRTPFFIDMGSGVPFDLADYGIPNEWTIPQCLESADIVSFSADKVLGGPQAGIILGRHDLIQAMARHPLHRAVRIDKLGIASLNATLRLLSKGAYQEIPVLRMISQDVAVVRARARKFKKMLDVKGEIIATQAVIGGGSAPTKTFASCGVEVNCQKENAPQVHARLRLKGVVCRIEDDRLIFDMRTVSDHELKPLAAFVNEVSGYGA